MAKRCFSFRQEGLLMKNIFTCHQRKAPMTCCLPLCLQLAGRQEMRCWWRATHGTRNDGLTRAFVLKRSVLTGIILSSSPRNKTNDSFRCETDVPITDGGTARNTPRLAFENAHPLRIGDREFQNLRLKNESWATSHRLPFAKPPTRRKIIRQ
jgi:hypothetical protein